jgi:hypothetical protein
MAQNKKQYHEFNCETGETTVRDFTAEELAQYEADQAAQVIVQAEAQTKATAKADLLAKLGITAEEAALLLS